jgi:hypothetical protein
MMTSIWAETLKCGEFWDSSPLIFLLITFSQQAWPDSTISNKHLRVRCVVFEEDLASGVPPLIYIEDYSTNGTTIDHGAAGVDDAEVSSRTLRKGSNAFLLTHGNYIHLSPKVSLHFQTLNPSEKNQMIDQFYHDQTAEAKVRNLGTSRSLC